MSKKNEVHVHHHYAPKPKGRNRRAPKKPKKGNSNKKVISVVVNIIDELVRLM